MGKRVLPGVCLILTVMLTFPACAPAPIYRDTPYRPTVERNVNPPAEESVRPSTGETFAGFASYYGPQFVGRSTATGETFDPRQLTAAHRTLPFGTMLKVTLVASGKSVVVRVNDRGPYSRERILDLSEAAAEKIGLKQVGVGYVQAEILSLGEE